MILFYHLTRSTAQETAATLLSRAADRGMRVMVRGTDKAALERLDMRLWVEPEDGFLPHGVEGGPQDAEQPILIGTGAAANGAVALMLMDGAEVDQDEARAMERVWVLFDGADPAALNHARGQWTRLTGLGLPAQYWSEDSGRWEKKAGKNE
ncbi:MAG: DNA polymerase III subunit chi [Paracoccaceae bacterium]